MSILYLVADEPGVRELYLKQAEAYMERPIGERDAGFDLFCADATVRGDGMATKVSQTCRAAVYDIVSGRFRAYWMLPRSSISKTPIRMANSVGLIDAGYRGPLLGMVYSATGEEFNINFGDRYFQIAGPELLPFTHIKIVDDIPGGETLRSSGGFGSTGVNGIVNYVK